jgi:isopentenyl-diphosphate delta-isomerase
MSKVTPTSDRKAEHIKINLEEDVQSGLTTGLERLHFVHQALPEIDLADIDITTVFFEKTLSAPIIISAMTGGTDEAQQFNLALAEAAQASGIAMGLGSQRAAIEEESLAATFNVRKVAPNILLFANLGAVQLNYGYGIDECRRAVEMVEADALVLHLNPLQEALQPLGDVNFSGLLEKIEAICTDLSVPVIVKEVGWGISAPTAKALVDVGVKGIDVAGAGGTSWSQVEMYRADSEAQARLAAKFINWGIPTARALLDVRNSLPKVPLIASGGIRNGIDIAKCVCLGANLAGLASPFLKAAKHGPKAVFAAIDQLSSELRVCMFGTGSKNLDALRHAELRGKSEPTN